eukprot:11291270-Alexandrium_andersonii.AAC.1
MSHSRAPCGASWVFRPRPRGEPRTVHQLACATSRRNVRLSRARNWLRVRHFAWPHASAPILGRAEC